MTLPTYEHANRWSAAEAVALDVPARMLEHRMPRSREARDVCHLTTRDEGERRRRGKSEELLQPLACHLFDDSRCRSADDQARILIPGAREPVGRQRSRKRAADDEAEVASSGYRDHARVSVRGQLFDDDQRVDGFVGKRASESMAQLVDRRGRPHGSFVQRLEKIGRDLRRAPKQLPLAHRDESMSGYAAISFSKRSGSSNGPTTAR